METIIFFDGECALCHRAVRFILGRDRQNRFLFAPLQGKTARKKLPQPISLDSMVLLHNGKIYVEGKGALRICWLLGGVWRLLGAFSFFPSWIANACYKLVARNRHLFSGSTDLKEVDPSRLLS